LAIGFWLVINQQVEFDLLILSRQGHGPGERVFESLTDREGKGRDLSDHLAVITLTGIDHPYLDTVVAVPVLQVGEELRTGTGRLLRILIQPLALKDFASSTGANTYFGLITA
jgi:hypothetical protein